MRAKLVILLLYSAIATYAQPLTEEWSIYSLDTNPFIGAFLGTHLYSDSAGFIYSAGSAAYENTIEDSNETDILIVKYDADGNTVWKKVIRTNSEDGFNDLSFNQEGQILLLGASRNCDTFVPNQNCLGDIELWLTTLDQDTGDILSTKVISGSMLDVGDVMHVTKQNEIIISGATRSSDGFFMNKNNNFQENFLLKLNEDKSLAWLIYYEGRINSILEKDGVLFTSGVTQDASLENSLAWIRTLDSQNGNLLNDKQFIGNNNEFRCLIELDENNIYLNISSDSNNGVFSNSNGDNDMHLLKLDFDLELKWSKSFGGEGIDSPQSFSFDDTGNNLLICGSTFSNGGIVGPRNNIVDAFIIKVNKENGELIWSQVLNKDKRDIFGVHVLGNDGSIYVSSSWSDNPNSFLADIVLITKLKSEIEILPLGSFDVDILPNPIHHISELNIQSSDLFLRQVNLELVDVHGRILYNKNDFRFTEEKMSLDINLELPSGAYFLRIFNDDLSVTKPIIIAIN